MLPHTTHALDTWWFRNNDKMVSSKSKFDDKIMDIKIIYSIMYIPNSLGDIHDTMMDIERYP